MGNLIPRFFSRCVLGPIGGKAATPLLERTVDRLPFLDVVSMDAEEQVVRVGNGLRGIHSVRTQQPRRQPMMLTLQTQRPAKLLFRAVTVISFTIKRRWRGDF